ALVGLLLMIVLIGALLRSWRAAVIGGMTISLALIAAAYVLYLRGVTFNVMILAGLVVALGVVVDDAVVTVLAIKRRLREPRAAPDDRSVTAVVVDACLEVRAPLLYATAAIVLAVLPLLLFSGVAGSFARPVLVSYLLAVLASLAVAVTVTPALAYPLLSAS